MIEVNIGANPNIQCKPTGEGGGDTFTFDSKGLATQKMLDSIAENILAAKSYSGYDGSFQAWHLPIVSKGDTAEIRDAADSARNGRYFVKAVTTTCNNGGITRQITLGKKL